MEVLGEISLSIYNPKSLKGPLACNFQLSPRLFSILNPFRYKRRDLVVLNIINKKLKFTGFIVHSQ